MSVNLGVARCDQGSLGYGGKVMMRILQGLFDRLCRACGWTIKAAEPLEPSMAHRVELALAEVAADAVPAAAGQNAVAERSLSTLNLHRQRPSMLSARLHGVARLNGRKNRKGRKLLVRGGRLLTPRPAVLKPSAAKRSPTLAAIKRKSVLARKASTRIVSPTPKRASAVVVRLHPCAARKPAAQRKRAA